MTSEILAIAINLKEQIDAKKKELDRINTYIIFLKDEHCFMANIDLKAVGENYRPIHSNSLKINIEAGLIIDVLKDTYERLTSEIYELEFNFKKI